MRRYFLFDARVGRCFWRSYELWAERLEWYKFGRFELKWVPRKC
jgi:hypothetical protein